MLTLRRSLHAGAATAKARKPNILFIMSDDHAAHAISAYGSVINKTPHIDRLATEGMRLDSCFCTNSICTPSRATILSGQYGHKNGVCTLADHMDGTKDYLVQKQLQQGGYQTAIIGKWHLGHGGASDPTGFDYWCILPGQGAYHNPRMSEMGTDKQFQGYVTDIITDNSIAWLEQRDRNKPFFLMCHHKAPHRNWQPAEKYKDLYRDVRIPEPTTFNDDYANRCGAAAEARMRIDRDMEIGDYKEPIPEGLSPEQRKSWIYQRYIKDYLRCIASVDDSVGRLLDYLDAHHLAEDTIVIYTSDQGFFLGDHGWYDKRFMYEQSLRMPFLVRYPREIRRGAATTDMLTNTDFAPTFLDYAGLAIPTQMQGVSARAVFQERAPVDWQKSIYYRYWQHLGGHRVWSHYGVRTHDYKLIYYYGQALGKSGTIDEGRVPAWELFDLKKDPSELFSIYGDPEYAKPQADLTAELSRLQKKYEDEPQHLTAQVHWCPTDEPASG